MASPTRDAAELAYVEAHQKSLEKALSAAINITFAHRPADPVAYISSLLNQRQASAVGQASATGQASSSARPPGMATAQPSISIKLKLAPLFDGESSDDWNLKSWVKGAGTDRVVTAELMEHLGSKDDRPHGRRALSAGGVCGAAAHAG